MTTAKSIFRIMILGVTICLTVTMLSACGGTSATTDDGSGAFLPPAEGKIQYPLTIETARGQITIDERPERIAAVNPSGQDTELLLALGVTPVITSSVAVEQAVWNQELGVADIENVFEFGFDDGLPIEEIAAAEPDLIIATQWVDGTGNASLGDYYDKLSAIAPVLVEEHPVETMSAWQDSVPIVGEALDLQEAAAALVDDDQEYFENIRSEHPEFADLTTSFAMIYSGEAGLQYISAPGSSSEKFFTHNLGFAVNPLAEQYFAGKTGRELRISNENISQIDADILVLGVMNDDLFAELQTNPLFTTLNAVTSGRMVSFSNRDESGNLPWALAMGGPTGQRWAAEQLLALIDEQITP